MRSSICVSVLDISPSLSLRIILIHSNSLQIIQSSTTTTAVRIRIRVVMFAPSVTVPGRAKQPARLLKQVLKPLVHPCWVGFNVSHDNANDLLVRYPVGNARR